jgi:ATP-dependent Lon protease
MLPARNRKDYEDIPPEIRDQLEFIWLEKVEEAAAASLEAATDEPARSEASEQAAITAAA